VNAHRIKEFKMKRKTRSSSPGTKTRKARKKRKVSRACEHSIPVEKPDDVPMCSICYDSIKQQGILNCCKHEFCFNCIETWSKVENTCPLCKRRFGKISKTQLWGVPPKTREKKNYTIRTKNQAPPELNPEEWGELAVVFSEEDDWSEEDGEVYSEDHMWRLFRVLTQNTGTLLNHLRRNWRINIQVSPNPVEIDLTGDSDDEEDVEMTRPVQTNNIITNPYPVPAHLPPLPPPAFFPPPSWHLPLPHHQQNTHNMNNNRDVVYDLTGDSVQVVTPQHQQTHIPTRHSIPPPPDGIRLPPIMTQIPVRHSRSSRRRRPAQVVDLVNDDYEDLR